MDDLHGATWATVLVALFVLLNNLVTAYTAWQARQQRSRIERKVDEVHRTAVDNGHST